MTESRHVSQRMTFAHVAGALSAAMGLFVLSGWALGVPWIKSVLPGAVEMKANTAVGLLLAGVALCLLDAPSPGRRRQWGQALALIVMVLGAATMAEYVFDWRLGIDEFLFRDTSSAFNPFRGRMSPYSAVVFVSLGLGLAALPARALRWLVWTTATLTLLIGGASFIGYLWHANELVTDHFLPPVAVHTAAAFILLGLGMVMSTRTSAGRASGKPAPLSAVEIKTLTAFLVTLVVLLLAGGQTYRAAVQEAANAQWVAHTQEVRANLGRLYAAITDAEAQQRNYFLSGDPQYLAEYKRHVGAVKEQGEILAELVTDNPAQTRTLKQLLARIDERLAFLEHTIAAFEKSGLQAAQAVVRQGEGRQLMESIQTLVRQMDSAEEKLLQARESASRSDKLKTLFFLLITLAVAVAGYMALFSGIRREMNARTAAEELLRRSEENLAVTLHSIGDAVLATDTDGRVTRLNPIAEKLTGWTQAEALGRPVEEIFRIINEETRRPAVVPVERVLATGEIQGLANHTLLIARDGAEWPIADSAAPIQDKGGNVLGVVLVFRNVNEERRASAEIARNVRLLTDFKSALDEHAIVTITDERGMISYVNDKFCALSKYSREELIGRDNRIINSGYHPKAFIAGLWETITSGRVWKGEIRNRAKDGALYWVNTTVVPFLGADGKPIQFIAIQADITERKRAQEELDRFFTLSLDFLCIASADGYFKRVSPAITEILGWNVEEFLARPYIDFVHPDDHAATLREVEKQVVAGQKVLHFENRYRHKNGSWRTLSWRSVPHGNMMYATARDVTELKRQEEQVRRLNDDLLRHSSQLEAANKELESFSYSVSHDLRAPLRHVQGYVEMLAREAQGQLSDKGKRYLKTITDASVEMGQLIDDLLAFSRMGRVEMRESRVELDRLVKDALRGLEMATKDRKVAWTIAPLPTVVGDPALLKQVLANLLGNAVKYSRERDPAKIEIGCAGEEEGRTILFVRDNGAGFDMEYAHKLFGVFQRLHRAEEFEGTGIGLANVRRIIVRHGGRTWAEGKINEGATFYFTLKPVPSQ